MTNRKLIKHAVASGRISRVAREENWGVGSPIYYHAELADDSERYARSRSDLTNIGLLGCGIAFLSSAAGAITGAVLGACLVANGDDTGLLAKAAYKVGAGVGGFVGGGVLGGVVSLAHMAYNEKVIENVSKERERRHEERGIKGVSVAQRRSAYGGLISGESVRFDRMTDNVLSRVHS